MAIDGSPLHGALFRITNGSVEVLTVANWSASYPKELKSRIFNYLVRRFLCGNVATTLAKPPF